MTTGRTVSIRIREGVPEQIRAAYGISFSEFVRTMCYSALEARKQELRAKEQADGQ